MRDFPSTLFVQPVPDDFTTPISVDDRGCLVAKVRLGGLLYELGMRPGDDEAVARGILRTGIWQLMEFERLGRHDLMAYASERRHNSRQRPQLTGG